MEKTEADEPVNERHLIFGSSEALTQALSSKRLELLKWLHSHEELSVRARSKHLKHDYGCAHEDVPILCNAGLIADKSLRVECDRILTEIAL